MMPSIPNLYALVFAKLTLQRSESLEPFHIFTKELKQKIDEYEKTTDCHVCNENRKTTSIACKISATISIDIRCCSAKCRLDAEERYFSVFEQISEDTPE